MSDLPETLDGIETLAYALTAVWDRRYDECDHDDLGEAQAILTSLRTALAPHLGKIVARMRAEDLSGRRNPKFGATIEVVRDLLSESHRAPPPPDARDTLWQEGLPRLRRLTGLPDYRARSLLGRLLRDARDDCSTVSMLLHQAEADRVAEPIAWLTTAIAARTGTARSKLSWMLDPRVQSQMSRERE